MELNRRVVGQDCPAIGGDRSERTRRTSLEFHRFYSTSLAGVLVSMALLGVCSTVIAGPAPITDLPSEYDLAAQVDTLPSRGTVWVAFNSRSLGQGYLVTLEHGRVILTREAGGRSVRLAAASSATLGDRPFKLTIKRRRARIEVLAGSQLLMNVDDNTFSDVSGAQARASGAGGAQVADLKIQPIDSDGIYFDDNFMRQPTEPGEWTYARGTWRIQTVGFVDRGANPFSLESVPAPDALAIAGYPFWSDYSFECAVKPNADTTVGLCVNVQDEHNYYLLRWSGGPKGSLDLVRVVDGKDTVLASRPGGFIPMLWYQIKLKTSGGRVIAEVDHQRVLNVEDTTFAQGKIGLYSAGAGNTVWFDSVIVRDSNLLYDDLQGSDVHHWQLVNDRAIGGDPSWHNYTVTASVVGSRGLMGIPLRYQDEGNFYIYLWSPKGSELLAIVKGKRKVLDDSSVGIASGTHHTVQAGVEDDYIWAAIDGKRVVEGVDFGIQSGRAGLSPSSAADHSFTSVFVDPVTAPDPFDQLTPEFQNIQHHPEMAGWSGPLHAWDQANFGKEVGYWHKGSLFGNITVKIPLVPQNLQSGEFGVILAGDGGSPSSGYELDYTSSLAGGINMVLLRQGSAVAKGHLKTPATSDNPPMLEVHRQGRFVYAGIGDDMPLRYMDPSPLDGYALEQTLDRAPDAGGHSKLGLIIRGATALDMENIQVSNRHVYAETFHLAPVNWRPQSGLWEVTNRWSCQPSWTWYGGTDPGYCVNWDKSSIWGDQTIDFYAGSKMGATPTSGSEAWRDISCSFCADGVNIFSGYTLMVGAANNTVSRLYRKGKLVGETDKFHFPSAGVAHRLWFNVEIAKTGGHIVIGINYLDGQGNMQVYPLFDYTDTDPIPGGYFSFWTYNNGMVIARAVLSYQQKEEAPFYSAADPVWLAREPADAPYPGSTDAGLAMLNVPGSPGKPVANRPAPAVREVATIGGVGPMTGDRLKEVRAR